MLRPRGDNASSGALAIVAVLCLGACATFGREPADTLDLAARDYVALQLAIGEKKEGYIDAYYGPPKLRTRGLDVAPQK
jgi:hypothetical protein